MHERGMNIETVPVPQQTPVEERRQLIKTKALGRSEAQAPGESFREKLEAQRRNLKQDQDRQESQQQAEKHRETMLAKVGARRHLQYEVIEDAAIVQVSVINSEDGTVIRKVPPDEVVGFVKRFKASAAKSGRRLDMTL